MVPTKKETPYVPLTAEEIVDDTYKAYKLGASVVHIHARDKDGNPAYEKEIYKEILDGIKKKCPDIITNVSTSGRVNNEVERRAEALELNPEMASLTVGSLNFPSRPSINSFETIKRLASLMKERSIMPELEIFESGFINTAKYLTKCGYLRKPLHFNLLLGSLGSIPAGIEDLVYLVKSLPPDSTWSATGIGRFQTQINAAAILMGGHVRVGIEDSIYYKYENKELATNTQLVERIVKIAKELGSGNSNPH